MPKVQKLQPATRASTSCTALTDNSALTPPTPQNIEISDSHGRLRNFDVLGSSAIFALLAFHCQNFTFDCQNFLFAHSITNTTVKISLSHIQLPTRPSKIQFFESQNCNSLIKMPEMTKFLHKKRPN